MTQTVAKAHYMVNNRNKYKIQVPLKDEWFKFKCKCTKSLLILTAVGAIIEINKNTPNVITGTTMKSFLNFAIQ